MHELTVMDQTGRIGTGQIRFGKAHPDDNIAALHITNHTERCSASVWLDHQSGVWLMAALGAFAAGPARPPLDEIAVLDSAGYRNGRVRLQHDRGPIAALHITNHTDHRSTAVALDRRMATELMVALGAFVATT